LERKKTKPHVKKRNFERGKNKFFQPQRARKQVNRGVKGRKNKTNGLEIVRWGKRLAQFTLVRKRKKRGFGGNRVKWLIVANIGIRGEKKSGSRDRIPMGKGGG